MLVLPRQEGNDPQSFTVSIDCELGNEYDGRLGLRISAIFVIFIGSMLGCVGPLALTRFPNSRTAMPVFFAARFFGSGVIIATAFIHLLAPAISALYSPCLNQDSVITMYPWPEAICLMSVFAMFFTELVVSHYVVRLHRNKDVSRVLEQQDSSISPLSAREPGRATSKTGAADRTEEPFAVQLTAIFILEFGIIFHSVLIGLTLGVAGEELVILYIVLTFHQTFEAIGLGSRLAFVPWPEKRRSLPYILSAAYSLSTPVAIAIGLGVRQTFQPGSHNALVISGIFDSISAGILLYAGLIQLMAYDFFYSPKRYESLSHKLMAFGWMAFGAGLMALLGKWA